VSQREVGRVGPKSNRLRPQWRVKKIVEVPTSSHEPWIRHSTLPEDSRGSPSAPPARRLQSPKHAPATSPGRRGSRSMGMRESPSPMHGAAAAAGSGKRGADLAAPHRTLGSVSGDHEQGRVAKLIRIAPWEFPRAPRRSLLDPRPVPRFLSSTRRLAKVSSLVSRRTDGIHHESNDGPCWDLGLGRVQ